MLRRAPQGPSLSRSDVKAQDDRKDTILLLLGVAAVVGFVMLAMRLPLVSAITVALSMVGSLRLATQPARPRAESSGAVILSSGPGRKTRERR